MPVVRGGVLCAEEKASADVWYHLQHQISRVHVFEANQIHSFSLGTERNRKFRNSSQEKSSVVAPYSIGSQARHASQATHLLHIRLLLDLFSRWLVVYRLGLVDLVFVRDVEGYGARTSPMSCIGMPSKKAFVSCRQDGQTKHAAHSIEGRF